MAPKKNRAQHPGSGNKKRTPSRAADKKKTTGKDSAKSAGRRPATKKKTSPRRRVTTGRSVVASAGESRFGVVGIGASAGGLDAFRQFLTAVPSDSGTAFVLIQHLDPTHGSMTAELLSRHTAMPVVQVEAEMPVEPDHVYVIPPNRYLAIGGGRLHLTEPVECRGLRMPIDFFLRSLAEDQRERAVGVIFTGTGTDGTLGVREVKALGGMVMVQAPETAQYDGMPRSAINTGVVDYTLPIGKMPDVLMRYVQHWYVNGAAEADLRAEESPDDLNAIIGLLRAHVKYDFSCYKKGTLIRRIERRMSLNHAETLGRYVETLRTSKDEVDRLYKDLLISVTNFFREPEAWDALGKLVIEPLVAAQPANVPIRVWVPGCATGEEPYSVAMLLFEALRESDKACNIQVFASDIDRHALSFARAGIYPENIAADVSPQRLRRFFVAGEHTYRINKEIREAVVFAEQNVISDPPFSKLDLISCRNLLIYLEPKIQGKILSLFNFALRESGYLFLGNAETISQQHDLFKPLSRKLRIYRRIGTVPAGKLPPLAKPGHAIPAEQTPLLPENMIRKTHRLATLAQLALLQRFAPACALVDGKMKVLYLHGPIDDYLQLPAGEPTPDLIAMARPGLRTRLRTAIRRATTNKEVVLLDDVRIKRRRESGHIRVCVEPLRDLDGADGILLVTFDDANAENRVRVVYADRRDSAALDDLETPGDYEAVVRNLEDELRGTREDLQTTIEDLETANEEFKAANEEIMSVNEELQSTNEELETSKEELQSLNEELQTVNSQLEQKVAELESTTNDLLNLLASTDVATIFLDRELLLRRFTPTATELLRVIDTDVGRPISDFAMNVTDEELLPDVHRVLQQLVPAEQEVQDDKGRWYIRRIVPYRTDDDRIDGVVITFVDISRQKRDELELRELAAQLEKRITHVTAQIDRLVDDAPDAMVVVNDRAEITHVNRRAEWLFGYSQEELANQPLAKLLPERFRHRHLVHLEGYFKHPYPRSMGTGLQLSAVTKDGKEFPADIQLSPLELNGQLVALAAVRDESERVRASAVERRLATVLNTSPFSIVVYQPDGTIDDWNQGAKRLYGYTAAEAIGQNVQMLVPTEKMEEFRQIGRTLCHERPLYEFETVRLHKDGTRIDVATIYSVVKDANDNIQSICAITRDIGERKQLEQEMAELTTVDRQRLAAHLHDTVSQQISGVSMLAASLKGQLPADSPVQGMLDNLEAAADKAKQQLGDLARGMFPVERDARGLRVALAGLAEEMVRMYEIPCQFECPNEVEMEDNYTATHLYLIAREAVYNAVRHAQPSKIVIHLEKNDEGVCVSVRDDGIGMPTPSDGRPGGLGTRIMQHRCRLVRGRLKIDSTPGRGTVVKCTVRRRLSG
jgi:two-component system CheB/CheR fusion protein